MSARATERLTPEMYRAVNRKRHKFSARATVVAGVKFPSKLQALRYSELLLLQRAGKICDLRREVRYDIVVRGQKVCTYVADFVYLAQIDNHPWHWETVVEDAKGVETAVFKLKRKLMKIVLDIDVRTNR